MSGPGRVVDFARELYESIWAAGQVQITAIDGDQTGVVYLMSESPRCHVVGTGHSPKTGTIDAHSMARAEQGGGMSPTAWHKHRAVRSRMADKFSESGA